MLGCRRRVSACSLHERKVADFQALTRLREIIRTFQTAWKDFSGDSAALCSRSRHSVRMADGGFMAKQTRITIETDSLLILRGRSSSRAWCSQCAAEVETIALEDMGV